MKVLKPVVVAVVVIAFFTLCLFSVGEVFAKESVCKGWQDSVRMDKADVVIEREKEGYCEILIEKDGNPGLLYYKDGITFTGAMWKKGEMVSIEIIREYQTKRDKEVSERVKVKIPEMDKLSITRYRPSNGTKRFVYMFTDPDCSFCEKAKELVKKLADEEKIEIRVIWMPLDIHPSAKQKTISAVCNKISYEDYLRGDYKEKLCNINKEKEYKKAEAVIEQSIKLAQSLQINGTPTFITDSGQVIAGFNEQAIRSAFR